MHYNNNMLGCCFCTFYSARNDVFYFFENTDNQHHYYCTKIIPFIGKEKDSETGYCYFGARYYDSDLSGLFLSVDPMSDKYPSISPYAYCAWNPVKLVDPDGRDTLNYADSKFLRTQPDISNVLIINAHGRSCPPVIQNNNYNYDDDLPLMSRQYASTIADCIWSTNVYQENSYYNYVTPVFLISCQTGETSVPFYSFADGLDKALSNILVISPVGDVHTNSDKSSGSMWLSPKEGESYDCYWRVLYKGQDIGHIENNEVNNISSLLSGMQRKVELYNANHPDNQICLPELNLQ
ncbi:MAG: RHS repeat-associated core domain-containing protein [Bacteroidales bacterium]|nr:RHS repeat-associated core domain-containing protein [Bacteroidales bacterium]